MGHLRFRQVHLDFHTSEKIVEVGQQFDAKKFAHTLLAAGVDSITCFARCHHGMIYYDTKFPAKHPGLKIDLLEAQIKACHEVGIKVPIYITVGWDEYIASRHPEWLERNAEGKPYGAGPLSAGWKKLCFNTPYIDYLTNQTIEVLEKFGDEVDGLFFDIISQNPCCCNYCLKGMEEAGIDSLDDNARRSYARGVLNNFKHKMTELVRRYNKKCSIFYNAGHVGPNIRETIDDYTHLELESLPSGGWGYEHFPITVRFAKKLNKEYLAMTGKFHKSWADFGGFKTQPALEYECFSALANGAKCSIGDQLHPNGDINEATYELIGSVYNQVKEKEEWCDDVEGISEIGIITPEIFDNIGVRIHPSIKGAYRMLIESHYQFDILDTECDFNKYKLIILPDIITLDDSIKNKLDNYLELGGKLILSYKSGMDRKKGVFALDQMGIELVGDAEYSPDYVVANQPLKQGLLDTEYVMYERGLWVTAKEDTEILAKLSNPYFNRAYNHFCSHFQTPVEKDSGYPAVTKRDNIIYFSHPIFHMYAKHGMRAYKQLVLNSINELYGEKLINTNAPTTAHINLNYQQNEERYIAHILHYIPERRFEALDTIEDIIPLYNIQLKVKMPNKPSRVYIAPDCRELDFLYEDGYANIMVPKVVGHEMIVFETRK